jgi:hypothetical protein
MMFRVACSWVLNFWRIEAAFRVFFEGITIAGLL